MPAICTVNMLPAATAHTGTPPDPPASPAITDNAGDAITDNAGNAITEN